MNAYFSFAIFCVTRFTLGTSYDNEFSGFIAESRYNRFLYILIVLLCTQYVTID